jgi:protein-disulfide isomerase
MSPPTRRLAIAAAFSVLAFAGGVGAAPAADGDMSLGPPNAKVTVTEYASLSCSHCAAFHNEVFPAFKKKYVDTGKVRYVLREVLTEPRDFAAVGYMTARCAGPDKYFAVVGEIFRSHPELAKTGDARTVLLRAAALGGLSEQQLQACIADQANVDALNARVRKAVTEGDISGTPTFFVNGKKIGEGEMTLAQLDAAIAAAGKK